jgi:PHD/YefM family antitoxin component YafN of YafNO toxin-antitoxin module
VKTKRVRSDEARRTFRALLNDVEHQGAHVTILRYDTPTAVLVPAGWYESAQAALSAPAAPDGANNVPAGGPDGA